MNTEREHLETTRAGLVARLAALDAAEAELLASSAGREIKTDITSGEGDSISVERAGLRRVRGQIRATIEDLDTALAALDQGTYGRCEKCGGEIGAARLEALPGTQLCIDCARAA